MFRARRDDTYRIFTTVFQDVVGWQIFFFLTTTGFDFSKTTTYQNDYYFFFLVGDDHLDELLVVDVALKAKTI